MNNIKVEPMEMSIINCAGLEGSDLAENAALVGTLGDDRMVRVEEIKASAEWVHLEHPRIKLHDG